MSYVQLCDKSKHEFLNKDGSLATFQPNIEVIAFALCNINRFTGHIGQYSVAQHSILCYGQAKIAEPSNYKLQLSALLHDATEAYLNDVASPLKALLPEYKKIENHYHNVIDSHFGISTQCDTVKDIDIRMLATEAHYFGLDLLSYDLEQQGFFPYFVKFDVAMPKLNYLNFMAIYNFLEQKIDEEKA